MKADIPYKEVSTDKYLSFEDQVWNKLYRDQPGYLFVWDYEFEKWFDSIYDTTSLKELSNKWKH